LKYFLDGTGLPGSVLMAELSGSQPKNRR
jgi:hypothetical protein